MGEWSIPGAVSQEEVCREDKDRYCLLLLPVGSASGVPVTQAAP